MSDVTVRIEISQRSKVKYKRTELGDLKVDKILDITSLTYAFDYGYIIDTLSPSGNTLGAVVICDIELQPNCLIDCKVIGVLRMSDEKGSDDKIILVPSDLTDKRKSKFFNNLDDVKHKLEGIKNFFINYKKTSKVENFENKEIAINIVKEWQRYFQNSHVSKEANLIINDVKIVQSSDFF